MAEGKIAVVGDRDSVVLFRALGVRVVFASAPREAEAAIHALAAEGVNVIFVTEPLMQGIGETLEKYRRMPFPAVIPIPNKDGTTGLGMAGVHADVEKAIGADILAR